MYAVGVGATRKGRPGKMGLPVLRAVDQGGTDAHVGGIGSGLWLKFDDSVECGSSLKAARGSVSPAGQHWCQCRSVRRQIAN
jgi:hypothetical protein